MRCPASLGGPSGQSSCTAACISSICEMYFALLKRKNFSMSSSVTGRSIGPFQASLSDPLLHSANSLFVTMRLREQQFCATYNLPTKVLAFASEGTGSKLQWGRVLTIE